MQEKSKDIDIIIRYLDNPQEEQLKKDVELFCSFSPENEALFKDMEAIWQAGGGKVALLSQINVAESVGHFQEILSRNLNIKHRNFWQPLLYAVATVVLVLGFYRAFFTGGENADTYIVYQTGLNKIDSVKLTDGSLIILAGNSSLRVPRQFKKDIREVYFIKGKGLFHIAGDVKRPFKVSFGSSTVEVLGTVFNIKTDSLKLEVGVKSGEVLFTPYQDAKSSLLKSGRAVNYDIKNHTVVEKSAANVDSWLTKNLVFSDTSLEDVCKQLSEYYKTSVELTPSCKNRYQHKKLNATFTDEPLDSVLDILKLTYGFHIYKKINQIIIGNQLTKL